MIKLDSQIFKKKEIIVSIKDDSITVDEHYANNTANVFGYDSVESLFSDNSELFNFWGHQFSKKFSFLPNDKILDLGCRNAKFTNVLSSIFAKTKFTATDFNTRYLSLAEAKSTADVNISEPDEIENTHFDAIVSVLFMHRAKEDKSLMRFVADKLKNNGKAYFQIFGDHKQKRFDDCIYDAMSQAEWSSYFINHPRSNSQFTLGEFCGMCQENSLNILDAQIRKYTYYFQSEDEMMRWIVTWNKDIHLVPNDRAKEFLSLCIENHLKSEPKTKSGLISYTDHVFEVIAQKQ